jgi:thiol-disulfide isomerase/thioredoxin
MHKLFLILLLFSLTLTAQEKNKILIDSKSGKPILVGLCDREAFADTNFAWWFNSGYKFYSPDELIIAELKKLNIKCKITIVMGTWCSDSRREVPKFYKILDELNYPEESLTLINVDRNKDGIDSDISSLNIELVPTFIVYRDGKEIGRIIETPEETLEKDLLNIIAGH